MNATSYPSQVYVQLLKKIFVECCVAEVGSFEHGLLRSAALNQFCYRFGVSNRDIGKPEACSQASLRYQLQTKGKSQGGGKVMMSKGVTSAIVLEFSK
jgi:hypothetical protein